MLMFNNDKSPSVSTEGLNFLNVYYERKDF